MAANPLEALIMYSLGMFIRVHKGACADFGLTLQTTNLKFPVSRKCVQKKNSRGEVGQIINAIDERTFNTSSR